MIAAPPSIRASSSTRPPSSSRCTVVRVRPRSTRLSICEVRVGVRGNLRQVRDAEHLKRRSERPQLPPDDVGHPPADAGVDLVEDQARAPTRSAAARSASLKPCRDVAVSVLIASMMRDSSPPDTIRASGRRSSPGFGDTKNSAASMPRALQADSGSGVAEPHLEPRPLHRQLARAALRAPRRTASAMRRRSLRQLPAPPTDTRAARPHSSRSSSASRSSPRSRSASSRRSASRRAMTSASVGPYLRFSRSSSASRSSTCCSRAGDASMPSA